MRTGGRTPSANNCLTASIFPSSRPTNKSFCSTEVAETFRSPTVTRSGSRSTERARFSTVSGKVALNKARTMFSFVHELRHASICSANPISKSLSASSRTSVSTLDRSIFPSLAIASSRRGFARRMSTLSKSHPAAVALDNTVHRSLRPGRSGMRTRPVCVLSSLVGEMTTARTPEVPSRTFCCLTRITSGIRNASVFPLPVGATTMSSRPPFMHVMACFCTAVGDR
mmetsp:Transcript_4414/g.12509  ORF Transcript_4414/g.12509 Transcript_4414/m.12509 type:complete len:227 (+) Transcript_4414:495-1175(+)